MNRPMSWRAIGRELRRRLAFDVRQQIAGWETFEPNLNGLPGPVRLAKYRVRPIGWRRLLRRYDRTLYR